MNIRQSRVCSIVFAGALIMAGSALAQPPGVDGGIAECRVAPAASRPCQADTKEAGPASAG